MTTTTGNIKVGVIISTYNNPQWLEKTLWGYVYQTRKADEIVVADDGSAEETRRLIESFASKLPIKHVWQEDDGFQKSRILNKALIAAESEYLIFSDQDCIPRKDFIETHCRYAKKGYYLSGGNYKLSMDVSLKISREDIEKGNVFLLRWLMENGQKINAKALKMTRRRWMERALDMLTTARATWNGCNASGWKEDLIAVNGFNEEMHYGGQDYEFGLRLKNMGVRSRQMRHTAIVVHLDHKRPYSTPETIEKNYNIRENTRKSGLIRTPNGIEKLR